MNEFRFPSIKTDDLTRTACPILTAKCMCRLKAPRISGGSRATTANPLGAKIRRDMVQPNRAYDANHGRLEAHKNSAACGCDAKILVSKSASTRKSTSHVIGLPPQRLPPGCEVDLGTSLVECPTNNTWYKQLHGVLETTGAELGTPEDWECAIQQGVWTACNRVQGALSFLNNMVGMNEDARKSFWIFADDVPWFDDNDDEGRSSLQFFFGDYSAQKLLFIRGVYKKIVDRFRGTPLIKYTCDLTLCPEPSKSKLSQDPTTEDMMNPVKKDCPSAWGATFGVGSIAGLPQPQPYTHVMFFCKRWFLLPQGGRWTNIVHEMFHTIPIGHGCHPDCTFDIGDCDLGFECRGVKDIEMLVQSNDWAAISSCSRVFDVDGWLGRFNDVMFNVKCYPLRPKLLEEALDRPIRIDPGSR